jgi:mutator protein MutT
MRIRNVAKTIILDTSGKVLLMRRSKDDTTRPGEWDFPGGGLEESESPLDAVVREAKEEAGLTLQRDALKLVYATTSLSIDDPVQSFNRFVFAAALPEGQVPQLSHEHEEFGWFSVKDTLQLFDHPAYATALRYATENNLLEF